MVKPLGIARSSRRDSTIAGLERVMAFFMVATERSVTSVAAAVCRNERLKTASGHDIVPCGMRQFGCLNIFSIAPHRSYESLTSHRTKPQP